MDQLMTAWTDLKEEERFFLLLKNIKAVWDYDPDLAVKLEAWGKQLEEEAESNRKLLLFRTKQFKRLATVERNAVRKREARERAEAKTRERAHQQEKQRRLKVLCCRRAERRRKETRAAMAWLEACRQGVGCAS